MAKLTGPKVPRRPKRLLQRSTKVRAFDVGAGLPNLNDLRDELDGYWEVLLGRDDPPIDSGVSTLAEVANAYYARAKEIEATILRMEAMGAVLRGSHHYRFRTGELRSFIEAASKSYELGSRRITIAVTDVEMRIG